MRPQRAGLDGESGVGLVELLVVMVLMTVIGGIATTGIVGSMRHQRTQVTYVNALNNAKIALENTTRELRAADPLVAAAPEDVTLRIRRGGGCYDLRIAWSAAGDLVTEVPVGASQRVIAQDLVPGSAARPTFRFMDEAGNAIAGTGPGGALLEGEVNTVAAITVEVQTEIAENNFIELNDTVYLRNRGGRECAP